MIRTTIRNLVWLALIAAGLVTAPAAKGQTAAEFIEWLTLYSAGDLRADYSGDGLLTPSDFNAFLQYHADADAGGNGNGNGDGNGSGGSDTGWTEFTESADTRKIFVAANGRDSNHGRNMQRPLRTVAEGVRRLRSGRPDWLLLRRGDTFEENLGNNWQKSGRSPTERMVIGAYGEGPRPVLITGTDKGLNFIKNDRRAHLAFVSLEFRPGVKYRTAGIAIASSGVRDVLFEDLLISGYTHAMALQGNSRDIAVRRCLLLDSGGMTHAQGLYATGIDGLLIEQSIIDRNGWREDRGRDDSATIFAHNVYAQPSVKNFLFRDNFSSRASSHGLQARGGGIVDRNVFWQNPIAMMYGNEGRKSTELAVSGTIDDNVVVEAINLNSSNNRGWGIHIQHADDVSISRNIVANSTVDGGYGLMLFTSNPAKNRDLLVEDNIVDDFGRNIRVDEDDVISMTLRGNIVTRSTGNLPLMTHRDDGNVPGLVYDGNRYRHRVWARAFDVDQARLNFGQWRARIESSSATVPLAPGSADPYVDGTATLADYARSLGYASTYQFMEAMRQQRKGNWDRRLTTTAIREFFKDKFTLRTAG